MDYRVDHRDVDRGFASPNEKLIIFGHWVATKPAEGSLHDPLFRQDLKALDSVSAAALTPRQGDLRYQKILRLMCSYRAGCGMLAV
jgi:hypothetical protein